MAGNAALPRICVDMDDVMADTLGGYLCRYNQLFNDGLTRQDLTGKTLREVTPVERMPQIRAIFDEEDFFEDLDVIPGSQEVLESLSSRFEIFVATQAMAVPKSLRPKFRWLQRHFPFLPSTHYVFCGNKSILRADYLIDDLPKNLEHFEGQGILYSAPPNRNASGFLRVENWQDVASYFAAQPVAQ